MASGAKLVWPFPDLNNELRSKPRIAAWRRWSLTLLISGYRRQRLDELQEPPSKFDHEVSGLEAWRGSARPPVRIVNAYAAVTQPPCLTTRFVEAGAFRSMSGGRIGLATRFPPQLGQTPPKTSSAHVAQKVHSNVQMTASLLEGGRSRSQHSQLGRNSSMF